MQKWPLGTHKGLCNRAKMSFTVKKCRFFKEKVTFSTFCVELYPKNFFSDQLNVKIITELQNIISIKSQSLAKNGILKNKSFMFTGKLEGISRAEAKSLIEKNSGITLSNVGKNLNYLVIGSKPTKRKVDKAKTLGINIISLEDLKKLLN